MIDINGHAWESKKEFEDYKEYLIPKLHEILDKGYSVDWDFSSNWVKITKYVGKHKAPDSICSNMRFFAEIKVFRTPSTYGIKNGKISKMGIKLRPDYPNMEFNREHQIIYFKYDRGKDSNDLKKDKIAKKMYNDIIEVFN